MPRTIKYVDFSRPNIFGQNVVFNEHLTNSSTLYGHMNAEGAISVGAADYTETPEFGTDPPEAQSFSAYGGTPILFDTAGTALSTPVIREKADVVGPDGVNTTFFGVSDPTGTGLFEADGFPNFFGTSAAAPHVAGLAALMLEAAPNLSPLQIHQILEHTAIDMDNPFVAGFQTGYDVATGHGLVEGIAAMNATIIASGDYNRDGAVNAADYVLWRDRLGSMMDNYASPDGSGNGNVGQEDYGVWRAHFGQTLPSLGSGSIMSQSAIADRVGESSETAISVAAAETTAVRSDLLLATAGPIRGLSTIMGRDRQARTNHLVPFSTARQDAALLAWLSAQPAERPDDSSSSAEEDYDQIFDEGDRYRNAVDSVIGDLSPLLLRVETAPTIGVG